MAKEPINVFLFASVASVNLIAFCAGSVFSWSSPVLPKLYSDDPYINPFGKPITIADESWIASLVHLGAVVGSLVCAPFAERFGRKRTLTIFSFTFLGAHLLFIFGTRVSFYLVGRFLVGIGTGCVFSAVPTYVSEISEDHNRGLLGCVMNMASVIGGLFNYTVGPLVSIKVLCILNLIPLVLYYVTFVPFMPESPFYFVVRNNDLGACNSLKKFRVQSDGNIEKELLIINNSIKEQKDNKLSFIQLFNSRALIKGLILTCGCLIFQQLSGITAFMSYMESIFEASGTSIPSYVSVNIVAAIQVLVNILTTSVVERLGKRLLMITSCTGNLISTFCLGAYFLLKTKEFSAFDISWLPTTSLIVFIICYNLGIGPLSWALTGEVFPPNAKSIATSISTGVCLGLAFSITMVFPYMQVYLGMHGTFWFFSVCCGLALIFTTLLMPEIKGMSLKEIQEILGGPRV